MPRFLLLFLPLLPKREEVVNALQMNAHSGAMPKSFSSSESSQLHGGAGLGVAFFSCDGTKGGTNANGEIRCLMSFIVYYNDCIIIRIHIFLCFYLLGLFLFTGLFRSGFELPGSGGTSIQASAFFRTRPRPRTTTFSSNRRRGGTRTSWTSHNHAGSQLWPTIL